MLCRAHLPEGDALECAPKLLEHYRALRVWAPTHDLIGPGTYDEVMERHYGEALAAVPLLPQRGVLVDVGSGAGFPGFVLACARPGLEVVLIEPRLKRVAFLRAAARAVATCDTVRSLDLRILAGRLALPLPAELPQRVDVVTVRALRLEPAVALALLQRLSPSGHWVAWGGKESGLPAGARLVDVVPLPGRDAARIELGTPS